MTSLILLLSIFIHGQALEVEYSEGVARNRDGQIKYIEKHKSKYENGKLIKLKTEYFTEGGVEIGSIETEYQFSPFVPKYIFIDGRSLRMVKVNPTKDSIETEIREGKDKKIEKQSFKKLPNMVAGQGLHNFLRENLSKFTSDSNHKDLVKFLVPLNKDYYNFRIRTKESNTKQTTFRIEPESWIFRLIAPHIDVTYENSSKRLLRYEGPSNLLDVKDEKMNVTINYSYPLTEIKESIQKRETNNAN